ncbi:MAG: alpha/beta fold hydrolase [Polyangiales bacterium]
MSSPVWQSPPTIRASAPDEVEAALVGADGTRLYVRRRGALPGARPNAPLALLCDGIACDGFIWKYLWDDLARIGPVAHWHYRGHGRSAPPMDPNKVQVVDYAADLDAIRKQLGDPPVVLIGHSFGVQVALEAYRTRPEGIAALVLCCGASGRVTETFKGTTILAQVLPKIVAWSTQYPELARAIWSRVPTDLSLKLSYVLREVDVENMRPDDLMPYLRHMTTIDFPFFARSLMAAGEHDAADMLATIAVPTLVIIAERDSFSPQDRAKALAAAIPGSESLVLKNGSHAALIEQPEITYARIGEFIQRVASAEAARVSLAG